MQKNAHKGTHFNLLSQTIWQFFVFLGETSFFAVIHQLSADSDNRNSLYLSRCQV